VVKKNDDSSIIKVLEDLKRLQEKKEIISANQEKLRMYFGAHYKGAQTDWGELRRSIDTFQEVLVDTQISIQLRQFLLTQESNLEFFKSEISILNGLSYNNVSSRLLSLLKEVDNSTITINRLKSILENIIKQATVIQHNYPRLVNLSNRQIDYQSVLNDLSTLIKLQAIGTEIDKQHDELKHHFSYMYTGIDTDWDTIIKTLAFASDFSDLIAAYSLPKSFVKNICEDE
jgi:hypothetical protein